MATVLTPEWEEQTRKNYRPRPIDRISNVSFPNRYPTVDARLTRYMNDMGGKIKGLLVGVGKKSVQADTCAVRHLELAGLMKGRDYGITVLDVDEQALDEAKKNAQDGRIMYVQGDIVTADLRPYGPFDIAECLMVLPHIGFDEDSESASDARVLAVANMAKNMKRGGLMVLDDLGQDQWYGLTGGPAGTCMKAFLNENVTSDIGISLDEEVKRSRDYSYLFYRKL